MTSLAHHAPTPGRSSALSTRTPSKLAHATGCQTAALLVIMLLLGVVLLGLVTLAIDGIDTGGRLPHPTPLPSPSWPSLSGS